MAASLRVWHSPAFEGLELNAHRGPNRVFPPSLVSGYNLGVRLQGVRETTYRKGRFRSGPGTFLAYSPGVALTAKPVSDDVWHYLDMTFLPTLLETLLGTDAAKLEALLLQGAVEAELNDVLFARFTESHISFQQGAPRLEQETKLLAWLKPLFTGASVKEKIGREPEAVRLVRDYLDAYATRNVSLDELAKLVGLNKHYLLRVFLSEVGFTPYKYQVGLRLSKAKLLLRQGMRPAQVAAELGFYDQSALNRLFKRHTFLTPGQYQRAARANKFWG